MKEVIINGISLYELTLYFFIYSFLGWIAEVIFAALKNNKFVNRGFLAGPVCPIYGVGMVVALIALNGIRDKWYLLFIFGALMATFLEFITGFILEKLFKTKWWDYSKELFNIGGYICLRFTLLWGVAILLIFNTLVPEIENLVDILPDFVGYILLGVFGAAFITDFTVTVIQLTKIGKHVELLQDISDAMRFNSDKIGATVSKAALTVTEKIEIARKKLSNTRLGKAFPQLKKKFDELREKSKNGGNDIDEHSPKTKFKK
ncbi:MAG TPA: hypothetical protein P5087_01900 [Eubacteriales bacterium]|nr:hypothetical protein [Eubacteriales bacterium]